MAKSYFLLSVWSCQTPLCYSGIANELQGGSPMARPKTRETTPVHLNLSTDIVAAIKDFQHAAKLDNRTQAYETLLRHALQNPPPPKP